MDQNSGGTSDKRNWRERLGIGTKDMPKLSEEFKTVAPASVKPAARPAASPVKAAPMAPRAAARPAAAPAQRPVAAPVAKTSPIAPDALASKLKTQRDAAEKLALQRVQAAKQKAEAALSGVTAPGTKPKFSFADETPAASSTMTPQAPIQTQPPRPAPAQANYVPPPQQAFPGQVQPPRPQLGVNPGYAVPPNYAQPGYAAGGYQSQFQPPPYGQQSSYGQQPGYRPIDPTTGFAPPPGYTPQTSRAGYQPVGAPQQAGPRLAMPPRAPSQPNSRLTNPPRQPQMQAAPDLGDDEVFEQPPIRPTRRATANEYQQAYRDEMAYEEEAPRRSGIWMFLMLGLLALAVALGAAFGYSRWIKPQLATSGGDVPVVAASQTAPKVVPDKPETGQAETVTNKKQIYDRIEGDHEVLGGQVKSTEEAPIQPAGSGTNAQPAAGVQIDPAANGNTGDGVPLPLPPPPGDTTGQQGQLDGPSAKTDVANGIPAAEQNSAAVLSDAGSKTETATAVPDQQVAAVTTAQPQPAAGMPEPAQPDPPAVADPASKPSQVAEPAIADVDPSPAVPQAKPKAAKPAPAKKVVSAEKLEPKSVKPVVLVPPKKVAAASTNSVVIDGTGQSAAPAEQIADNSLYGDAPTTQVATAPAQPKKSKSIFDLFKANNSEDTRAPAQNTQIAAATPAPAPAAPAAAAGGYVVQLASFKSKSEATSEYRRLGQKHGAIITRYAPIIETAQVAGSTRYRLNLGPMASNGVASGVCSSLISAGERDCIVRRQ